MSNTNLFLTYEEFSEINEKFHTYKYGTKKLANFEVLERENWVVIKSFSRATQSEQLVVIVKDDMLTELIKQLQIIEKNIS